MFLDIIEKIHMANIGVAWGRNGGEQNIPIPGMTQFQNMKQIHIGGSLSLVA